MKLLDVFDKDPDNQTGCSNILMKCLFSFVITYLILLIFSLVSNNKESQQWLPIILLIVNPIICIINSIYMFLLFALGFDKGGISGMLFILIESIFLIAIYSGISLVVIKLSVNVLYEIENGSMLRRNVFSAHFQLLFTYFLLTIFLVALRKILKNYLSAAVNPLPYFCHPEPCCCYSEPRRCHAEPCLLSL